MREPRFDIDEIDDLDMPVGIHGAGAEAATDMVADIALAIAIYTAHSTQGG